MVKVTSEVEIAFFITESDAKELDLKKESTGYTVMRAINVITATY